MQLFLNYFLNILIWSGFIEKIQDKWIIYLKLGTYFFTRG